MESTVKQEIIEWPSQNPPSDGSKHVAVIDLSSSSDSDSDSDSDEEFPPSAKRPRVSSDEEEGESSSIKKPKPDDLRFVLPLGFLDPLPPEDPTPLPPPQAPPQLRPKVAIRTCKQFWKAGDYEGDTVKGSESSASDNGGGMNPDKMRQCMSLGYSVKSKIANTIGQYGNGFKTSTMRLGADVIVFSRCRGKDGESPTQSIGMLSYTFLRSTRKEDIIVPMIDYENEGRAWNRLMRSSPADWNRNMETIVQWSPYSSEADLLLQFNSMKDQGTRVIIYNLWENDQGELELDLSADQHDIQLRGVNRDEKKIQMAKQFPNSRHFLTYQHSLRSYASILYLRLPPCFRIILRGKDVEYHNIVNDMMLKQQVTYRPQSGPDGVPKDPNMFAEVTIGFVKDAKHHIDVQGFNVYHKNRLIKPFWRVWNSTGSDGRGVIGVLEANFVEPAHDKQGFERTTVLSRLEGKLIQMQKTYWSTNCHKVGYARRNKKRHGQGSSARESSPEDFDLPSSRHSKKATSPSSVSSRSQKSQKSNQPVDSDKWHSRFNYKQAERADPLSVGSSKTSGGKHEDGFVSTGAENGKSASKFGNKLSSQQSRLHERSPHTEDENDHEIQCRRSQRLLNERGGQKSSPVARSSQKDSPHAPRSSSRSDDCEKEQYHASKGGTDQITSRTHTKAIDDTCNGNLSGISPSDAHSIKQLEEENAELKQRIKKLEESMSLKLQAERDKNKLLKAQFHELEEKLEAANKEQEALIDIFSEERSRRDKEEEILRKKLKDASTTIQELLEKVTSNT
ncbi:protein MICRORCHIDIA 7-like isoform X2 [Magnolia sinica]|uniref:protein MICRORCHIDIA 7-like isoform X2 n=1 Tax=Magnolia sinica TaxID=86752 RepID=UPI00265A61F0|nr:protein MICRORCHIDIA 7-like isoform X2 [Magnolia sinica]